MLSTDTKNPIADAVTGGEDKTDWFAEMRNLALLLLIVLGIHSFVAKPFYIPSASMMPGLITGDRLVVSKYPYGYSFASVSFHLLPPFSGRLFGRNPEYGDVVIVEPNGVREDYIKRVVALPGDTVQMIGGRLYLNGTMVPYQVMPTRTFVIDQNIDDPNVDGDGCTGVETRGANGERLCELNIVRETLPNGASYDTADAGDDPRADTYGPYTVPAGHVFLMGDNRDHSADSRFPVEMYRGLGGSVPLENIGGRAEFITFSLDGTAQWYNPISWFTAMRSGRAGTSLRPDHGPAPRTTAPAATPAPATAPAQAPQP